MCSLSNFVCLLQDPNETRSGQERRLIAEATADKGGVISLREFQSQLIE